MRLGATLGATYGSGGGAGAAIGVGAGGGAGGVLGAQAASSATAETAINGAVILSTALSQGQAAPQIGRSHIPLTISRLKRRFHQWRAFRPHCGVFASHRLQW